MKTEDRDRIQTGLSKTELQEGVPADRELKATPGDAKRIEVIKNARKRRLGTDPQYAALSENEPEPTDSIVVGAVISHLGKPTPESALASGLKWPPARIEAALVGLKRNLLATGQRLARYDDGSVEIRPAFEHLDETRTTHIIATSLKDAGLNNDQLSILWRIATHGGRGRYINGKPDLIDPNVQYLLQIGMLVETGTRLEVATHVRYSLADERVDLPFSPEQNAVTR